MFTHSIRGRLLLWLGLLLFCVLSGFGFTVYQLQRLNQITQFDEELERRVEALAVGVRLSPPVRPGGGRGLFERRPGRGEPEGGPAGERTGPGLFEPRGPGGRGRFEGGLEFPNPARELKLSPEATGLFGQTGGDGFYYAVWFADGSAPRLSSNAPAALTIPGRQRGDLGRSVRLRGEYREMFRFNGMGDCMLAGRPFTPVREAQRRFALMLLVAGGGVLAFGLGILWWLTTRAIRPVEAISAAARRISAGNLAERIAVAEPDNELGRLAGVLNSTFSRLETAFNQQKQFTADASHELRTPIAVIISETQTTLARPRRAEEYRQTVETCLEAAQQMRQLAHSLLELSRFDAGQEAIERRPLDLGEVARASVELVRPLARDRGLPITCDLALVQATGDAARLGQVITNFLTNAIHYNRDGGAIRVSTRSEPGNAVVEVTDTGQGIGPDDLPHIFERFYRADKSRARAEGRSGLGLAICRAIIDAHGGTIEVRSELGRGTTFTVRLPA